ncbi:Transcription factor GRAS [Macleaya cordata]|uniref:Transcription factor GRAS n=1 Tax=Macleaya cordata TaxID=56857 RepID=A0A200QEC6_MACCD|nr:Transcription factor GRAS [Macleaya cordata]
MMKEEFELVHGALDPIQTHEQWDCNIGFSADIHQTSVSTSSLVTPVIDNRYSNQLNERFELSEWIENAVKQLPEGSLETSNETLRTKTLPSTSEENFVVTNISDFQPQKSLEEIHWNGELGQKTNNFNEINGGSSTREMNRSDLHGLDLLTLLLECAVAISVDNLGDAHKVSLELIQMASAYGPSSAERVVAYFAMAMASRVMNSWLGICAPLINHKSIHSAFQVFNNNSPFIKFAHFTSNQAILEAFHQSDRVHIIDLDIMQGLQWPALFHILATRFNGHDRPPFVRMTGFGTSMEILMETGKQLSNFAKRLGLSFEFHPIAKKFGEIDLSMVQIRRGETVAVHWLQHSLYDATGPDWNTMKLLQQLSPRVITLVEQDIIHGGLSFLDRFVGSLHYYSTVFDSLGASLWCDEASRHHVEHCLLHKEINNILAIGGPARSGEEKFNRWRSELGRHCFVQVPMSGNAMAQAQLILNMCPPGHGYRLVQSEGSLRLGWKETSLYTASAWTSLNCSSMHYT